MNYTIVFERLFSRFSEEIKIANNNSEYDLNSVAEDVFIPILNETFDYDLVNANLFRRDYPAVDLVDDNNKVAFQVTASGSNRKIKDTITKFIDFELYKKYEILYFLFITTDKVPKSKHGFEELIDEKFIFEPKNNLFNLSTLYSQITHLSLAKIESIEAIVNSEFNRKNTNVELFKDYQRQLREVTEEIESFRPETARKRLDTLLMSVNESTLSSKLSNWLKAEIFYLMGLCKSDLGDGEDTYQYFIKAFTLKPDEIKYRERACTSYYIIDMMDDSKSLSEEILKTDKMNPRAWIVKFMSNENIGFGSIPSVVLKDKSFKTVLANLLFRAKRYDEVKLLLSSELDTLPSLTKIIHDELSYWMLIVSYLFNNELGKHPNYLVNRKNENLQKSKVISYCHESSKTILNRLENTELFAKNVHYPQIELIFHYTNYLLSSDRIKCIKNV